MYWAFKGNWINIMKHHSLGNMQRIINNLILKNKVSISYTEHHIATKCIYSHPSLGLLILGRQRRDTQEGSAS